MERGSNNMDTKLSAGFAHAILRQAAGVLYWSRFQIKVTVADRITTVTTIGFLGLIILFMPGDIASDF